MSNQNSKSNKKENQEKINRITNKNPFWEQVPGGYRESYKIIRCQLHLSATEKLLYDELLYYYMMSIKNGRRSAIPDQKTLAENVGLSQGQISRSLRKLEEHGLIKTKTRKGVWGNHKEYILLEFPGIIWDNYLAFGERQIEKMKERGRSKKEIEERQQFLKSIALEVLANKCLNMRKCIFRNMRKCISKYVEMHIQVCEYAYLGDSQEASHERDERKEKTASINQIDLSEESNHHQSKRNVNVIPEGPGDKSGKKDDDDHSQHSIDSKNTTSQDSDGNLRESPDIEKSRPAPRNEQSSQSQKDKMEYVASVLSFFNKCRIDNSFKPLEQMSQHHQKKQKMVAEKWHKKGYPLDAVVEVIPTCFNRATEEIFSLNYFENEIKKRLSSPSTQRYSSSTDTRYSFPDNLPPDVPDDPAKWTQEQVQKYAPKFDEPGGVEFWEIRKKVVAGQFGGAS